MEQDQEFLEFVVKALVDNPGDVKINRTVDEMGVLLTLDVNKDDMGKIIGRTGNTAKAVRTLLRVVGMKNDARVNLKINEPEGGMPPREHREKTDSATETRQETKEMSAADKAAASKSVDEAMEDLGL
ncbi:RNA-binding protein [bacterium]|nr:RNA-binding protein [bacterium]|tara:strand:+ start:836 stop:1219 length:384 start_codon:yes stop_codon:yes gene_type:complete